MSRNLSAAARRISALLPSTQRPDGYDRRPLVIEADDTVGEAIFATAPKAEVEDEYSRMALVAEREETERARRLAELSRHPLVTGFGFEPKGLLPFGFEVLAVLAEACRLADELANLAGPREVCRAIGWSGNTPRPSGTSGCRPSSAAPPPSRGASRKSGPSSPAPSPRRRRAASAPASPFRPPPRPRPAAIRRAR